jgi:asparagine synthase (glutamine-hydrolysing)
MLMAHSVEGRFPFLDREVMALAGSLPDGYLLRGLEEKVVLRDLARDLLPPEILGRRKQPYRAPDALSFTGPGVPGWVDEALGEPALERAGVFDPGPVRQLLRKCRERGQKTPVSNADNMALVGVLSTQLLHHAFVGGAVLGAPPATFDSVTDRLQGGPA